MTIDAIDAFIFGPRRSIRLPWASWGRADDPEVRAVIDEAIAKINAAGKVAGVSLGLADRENHALLV